MKFANPDNLMARNALTAFQSRLASHYSIELWAKELYETRYSSTKWPGFTLHKLRDPEHVKGVLVDHASCFAKAPFNQKLLQPVMGTGLVTSEGTAWKRQKAIAAPAFKKSEINRLAPWICEATQKALERLCAADREPIEVFPVMSELAFEVIRGLIFGFSNKTGMPFAETTKELGVCLSSMAGNDAAILNVASNMLRRMASEAIEKQMQDKGSESALFGLLREAVEADNEPLSALEFRDNVLTLMAAGHDTTATSATWALFLLAQNPSIQDDVASEASEAFPSGDLTADIDALPRLKRVILETMRLYPPVPSMSRIAVRPVTIADVHFSMGDIADIMIYPMHRSRLLWNDPDAFVPDRFKESESRQRSKFAYIPFGGGPRICIGSHFAIVELSLILASVLRSFRVLPVVGHDPKPAVRVTLQPSNGLPLYFERRPNAM